jgi:sodium/potassium-transporting ATPase subunit alpha
VNERSINSLKRRALRRSKTIVRDVETGQPVEPSRISLFGQKLRAPFTGEFWEDKFEKTDNETLVDNKLLSYAYLEAGLIETLAG